MKRKSEHLNGTVKRRKLLTDDGTPKYALVAGGKTVAIATMTGRPGVDNYPWDWHMVDRKGSWASDTLRNIVQTVEYYIASGGTR